MSVHLRSLIGTIADERATIQQQTGERGGGQPASGSPVNPPQGGIGSAAVIARTHYIAPLSQNAAGVATQGRVYTLV